MVVRMRIRGIYTRMNFVWATKMWEWRGAWRGTLQKVLLSYSWNLEILWKRQTKSRNILETFLFLKIVVLHIFSVLNLRSTTSLSIVYLINKSSIRLIILINRRFISKLPSSISIFSSIVSFIKTTIISFIFHKYLLPRFILIGTRCKNALQGSSHPTSSRMSVWLE